MPMDNPDEIAATATTGDDVNSVVRNQCRDEAKAVQATAAAEESGTAPHEPTAADQAADHAADHAAAAAPAPEEKAGDDSKKPSSSLPLPKRVIKTSLNFRSDVDAPSRPSHPRGILHATKLAPPSSPTQREEHAFAWIADNADDPAVAGAVAGHLGQHGFRSSLMRFIPFSSKEMWIARYPHAMPYVDCDGQGNITGNVPKPKCDGALGKTHSASKSKKRSPKGRKPPPKLLTSGLLPDAERDELHLAIHEYFAWLRDELGEMETDGTGRRRVSGAGINVPSLGGLVAKLEGTFRAVQLEKGRREREERALEAVHLGKERKKRTAESDAPSVAPSQNDDRTMQTAGAPPRQQEKVLDKPTAVPFLEQALEAELQRMVDAKRPKRSKSSNGRDGERQRAASAWRHLDFDALFQKLVEFKAEKGHTSPPFKHPELGRWVCELRQNKRALEEKGLECEPNPATAENDGGGGDGLEAEAGAMPRRRQPTTTKTFLSRERVILLDSIGFAWTATSSRSTWEERFEELRSFKERNGRFPTNKEGSIGGWLKGQRKLYSKRDAKFMKEHCAKLEELGVPLRQRHYTVASWDDRFQQLVEFGRVNRHFRVPNPDNAEGLSAGADQAAEAGRFFKYVQRIHTEYRAHRRGEPVTMLNEERITQLRNIGFEFSRGSGRIRRDATVPELDWSTRMQQMEAFLSEMGHLRVDPNYSMYSNLGGFAVQMSELHQNWQEGREYLPPDMLEKFNQLNSLGFRFDVFKSRRGERSWEDSFALLLQYRQQTGSCRVPHHYKADFRLGSWVAVQRKEYKLMVAGKPSRMTHEKVQRLESIGFEWVARRGE